MVNGVKMVVLAVIVVLLGAGGYLGTACASALYADHQLLNQIRANQAEVLRQQAEQVQQFRQQQQTAQAGAQAGAQAPVATPAK